MHCQAHDMDIKEFENYLQPVPECDGPRDVQRFGWWLCKDCAEALEGYIVMMTGVAERLDKNG